MFANWGEFLMRKIFWLSIAGLLILGLATSAGSDDQSELKALLDKGIKTAGGQEKLSKFKAGTCKIKGKILESGKEGSFTFDAFLQAWDQAKIEGEVDHQGMQLKAMFIVNGDQGWAKFMDNVEDAPKDAISGIKDIIRTFRYIYALTPLKDQAVTLSPLGEINVDGKAALGLKVACKDQQDIRVFLDKATGLPVKAEFNFSKSGGQEEALEFTVSDYKESNGIKHFSKVALKHNGTAIFEADLSDFKWVDKLEASVFEKP
ncbi:MAG TPA: hypothetical protein VGY77_04480 [Gemmataceae bacterium]|jgi:hypothetical protein|nr:hypothetical protein [Gemmataceae bacterium]